MENINEKIKDSSLKRLGNSAVMFIVREEYARVSYIKCKSMVRYYRIT